MKQKPRLLLLVMLESFALGSLGLAAGLPQTSRMNVLFVIVEDWSARTPGCYGNKICKTPNLDKFCETAVRFDSAYVQGIACNPSRSSFLSGLRPLTTQVWNNNQVMGERLPPGTITLPELMKQKGLTTAVIGKFFHQTEYARKQLMAFDRIESYQPPPGWQGPGPIMTFPRPKRVREAAKSNFIMTEDESQPGQKAGNGGDKHSGAGKNSDAQAPDRRALSDRFGDSGLDQQDESDYHNAQIACALLKDFAREKKQFFLSVHQSRPHTPYIAPKKFLDMYPPDEIPDPPAPRESLVRDPWPRRITGGNPDIFMQKPATPQQTRGAIAANYACVTMVDDHIGMILKALKEQGLADNTIVFIMGDHGVHLGDHGFWSKYSMHEETQRTVLWVRVPGAPANGKVCREFVEFVDFVPTLCELLQLDAPKNLEGISFKPLLIDPATPWKKAVFQVASPDEQTVRTKQYRYIKMDKRPVPEALYDEEKDPWETKNLAGDPAYAKAQAEMAELLKSGWKAGLPESMSK